MGRPGTGRYSSGVSYTHVPVGASAPSSTSSSSSSSGSSGTAPTPTAADYNAQFENLRSQGYTGATQQQQAAAVQTAVSGGGGYASPSVTPVNETTQTMSQPGNVFAAPSAKSPTSLQPTVESATPNYFGFGKQPLPQSKYVEPVQQSYTPEYARKKEVEGYINQGTTSESYSQPKSRLAAALISDEAAVAATQRAKENAPRQMDIKLASQQYLNTNPLSQDTYKMTERERMELELNRAYTGRTTELRGEEVDLSKYSERQKITELKQKIADSSYGAKLSTYGEGLYIQDPMLYDIKNIKKLEKVEKNIEQAEKIEKDIISLSEDSKQRVEYLKSQENKSLSEYSTIAYNQKVMEFNQQQEQIGKKISALQQIREENYGILFEPYGKDKPISNFFATQQVKIARLGAGATATAIATAATGGTGLIAMKAVSLGVGGVALSAAIPGTVSQYQDTKLEKQGIELSSLQKEDIRRLSYAESRPSGFLGKLGYDISYGAAFGDYQKPQQSVSNYLQNYAGFSKEKAEQSAPKILSSTKSVRTASAAGFVAEVASEITAYEVMSGVKSPTKLSFGEVASRTTPIVAAAVPYEIEAGLSGIQQSAAPVFTPQDVKDIYKIGTATAVGANIAIQAAQSGIVSARAAKASSQNTPLIGTKVSTLEALRSPLLTKGQKAGVVIGKSAEMTTYVVEPIEYVADKLLDKAGLGPQVPVIVPMTSTINLGTKSSDLNLGTQQKMNLKQPEKIQSFAKTPIESPVGIGQKESFAVDIQLKDNLPQKNDLPQKQQESISQQEQIQQPEQIQEQIPQQEQIQQPEQIQEQIPFNVPIIDRGAIGLPPIGGMSLGRGFKTQGGALGAKRGYAPSLTAVVLGIRGKPTNDVTGLGIRPIPGTPTKLPTEKRAGAMAFNNLKSVSLGVPQMASVGKITLPKAGKTKFSKFKQKQSKSMSLSLSSSKPLGKSTFNKMKIGKLKI